MPDSFGNFPEQDLEMQLRPHCFGVAPESAQAGVNIKMLHKFTQMPGTEEDVNEGDANPEVSCAQLVFGEELLSADGSLMSGAADRPAPGIPQGDEGRRPWRKQDTQLLHQALAEGNEGKFIMAERA